MDEEHRVEELLSALRMMPAKSGFMERTMRAIAAAEQARRLKQTLFALGGASALSLLTTMVVIASGFLKPGEVLMDVTLFASRTLHILQLALGTFRAAPTVVLAGVTLVAMSCAATTLLLARSVSAKA
jgi:hypothetical protein